MNEAKFEHASNEGWATYHQRHSWRVMMCRVLGHVYPPPPEIRNGYSPSNFGRCKRCRAFVKWMVVGQHRYGGLSLPE